MRRLSGLAVLIVCVFSSVHAPGESPVPRSTPRSTPRSEGSAETPDLAWVRELRADRMGTDGEGNLWTWERGEGRVEVWDASGTRRAEARVGRVEALDVDRRWGVAALRQDGRELVIQPFGEAPRRSLPLPDPAKGVAWLAADRVAVAPYGAAYRVAVWDLTAGAPVRTLGEEKPVEETVGAHFVRLVDLEPDPEGRRLYTLESFTGDLQVFPLTGGAPVYHMTLGNPRRREFEAMLAGGDRKARAMGGTEILSVSFFHLAVDRAGVSWVVKGCSEDRREAELARLPLDGEPRTLRVATDCCSRNFTLWQDTLIFHLGPEVPGRTCTDARILPRFPQSLWLEATPLDSQDAPTLFETLPPGPAPLGKLAPGWWMLCSGGAEAGTACERRFLEESEAYEARPAAGVAVTGSVVVGREPAAGAQVAVVPAGLPARRPFTVPLALDADRGELLRRVPAGGDGRFQVPPLAPGEYFLEILLPGGRIAAGDPFTVPPPEALRPAGEPPPGSEAAAEPVLELGEIRFPQGLSLEVWVTSAAGGPVPHARVGAGQGYRPEDAVFFETEADEEGKAVLAGLDPTLPMTLTCVAPGYRRHRERFDMPPAAGSCVLEELAALTGQVTDETETPVEGATVTLSAGRRSGRTGEDGAFAFSGIVAGVWEVCAAAPGLAAVRREVELAPGEELRLEPIRLPPGREIEGRVVDAETGEPVGGAAVTVTDPPGGGGTVSGEEGRFQLRAGTAEPLTVSVEAAGYARSVETLPPQRLTAEEPVRLTVSRGGRIEVLAWDAQGGPCVGCAVSVQGAGAVSGLRTGGDGRAVSELLAPGRWPVTLVRERGLGSVVKVSGGDDVRWAEVRPGQTVTVRFGEPRQEVVVHFEPPPPPGWRLEARGRESVEILERRAGGGFPVRRGPGVAVELALLGPPGSFTRVAQGRLPADFDAPQQVLELPRGGVRGVLVRGEEPAVAEPVQLFTTAGGLEAVVTTAADGSFSIPYLSPGAYALAAAGEVRHRFHLAAGRVEDLGPLEVAAAEAP